MKRYSYIEPGEDGNPIEYTFTEEEILNQYYPYWSDRLKQLGREHLISKERCLEDWIVVNWAVEVKD